MAFTLDQLRSFVAVAEELHFGRAAERLRMTQPPVSRQIQRLEAAIGADLFVRGSRRVEITAAGRALLDEARRLLALAEAATLAARRAGDGVEGDLTLGFTATAALGLLGTLVREGDEYLPGVQLRLIEQVTSDQLVSIQDGTTDLGLIRPLNTTGGELRSRLVHREKLVLALPTEHPLAHRDGPLTVADLHDVDLISYARAKARYFHDLVASILVNSAARVTHETTQVQSMLALVGAGRGVALVPESVLVLQHQQVVFRELGDLADPVVELHAVWSAENRNPALARALTTLPALRRLT
ncbi:MAG TPA: LysR family transcriptional regulator [Candidatus Lumbricidophila sp.]|nr:LysR family transcriptional regulator [Candidatus Lumbricidophila sp.]